MSTTGKYYPASSVIQENEYRTLTYLHQLNFELTKGGKIDNVEFESVPEVQLPDYTPVQPILDELPREDNEANTPKMDGFSTLD